MTCHGLLCPKSESALLFFRHCKEWLYLILLNLEKGTERLYLIYLIVLHVLKWKWNSALLQPQVKKKKAKAHNPDEMLLLPKIPSWNQSNEKTKLLKASFPKVSKQVTEISSVEQQQWWFLTSPKTGRRQEVHHLIFFYAFQKSFLYSQDTLRLITAKLLSLN